MPNCVAMCWNGDEASDPTRPGPVTPLSWMAPLSLLAGPRPDVLTWAVKFWSPVARMWKHSSTAPLPTFDGLVEKESSRK
jgi:hypothetical protein